MHKKMVECLQFACQLSAWLIEIIQFLQCEVKEYAWLQHTYFPELVQHE